MNALQKMNYIQRASEYMNAIGGNAPTVAPIEAMGGGYGSPTAQIQTKPGDMLGSIDNLNIALTETHDKTKMLIDKAHEFATAYENAASAGRLDVETLGTALDEINNQHFTAYIDVVARLGPSLPVTVPNGEPSIPPGVQEFAEGGVIPGAPGQAVPIIGHAGEGVIPARYMRMMNAGNAGGGGGQKVTEHIHIEIGGREIVRAIRDVDRRAAGAPVQ